MVCCEDVWVILGEDVWAVVVISWLFLYYLGCCNVWAVALVGFRLFTVGCGWIVVIFYIHFIFSFYIRLFLYIIYCGYNYCVWQLLVLLSKTIFQMYFPFVFM